MKRINVFNKESGIVMRVTVQKAVELSGEGYKPTTKNKLHSFLNRERKLQKNMKTLDLLEVNPHVSSSRANPHKGLYKMPSGKVHIVVPSGKGMRKHLIISYPD